jgi:hypothetical protein
MIFQQKPPKIKEAIIDYLKKIVLRKVPVNEIVEKTIQATAKRAKTPRQSIKRTLNELYNKGILQKYYVDEQGNIKLWPNPTQEAERAFLDRTRLPRLYSYTSVSIRKEVSTSLYCGSNTVGAADDNPNAKIIRDPKPYRQADTTPRKRPSDVIAWTFVSREQEIEFRKNSVKGVNSGLDLDTPDDWKAELAAFLLQKFKNSDKNAIEDCVRGDSYVHSMTIRTFMAILGYDESQSMTNVPDYQLYPVIKWKIRGVEQ